MAMRVRENAPQKIFGHICGIIAYMRQYADMRIGKSGAWPSLVIRDHRRWIDRSEIKLASIVHPRSKLQVARLFLKEERGVRWEYWRGIS